ncbi:MAG: TIGR03936 family radical SAM-associated protein [Anaerolineales bacterium]|jgi:radical SAM-linked protein|nr:TIGR03936 family radical SAM-associated protein [Anaerolineales bacterium]
MRLRISFEKTDLMRFSGHLDLHRAWERLFRRAGIPLAYSQGFNPHPRLNLAAALPLGFTSADEWLDAWIEQDLPLPQIERALTAACPPGIRILRVAEVEGRLPSLPSEVCACEYQITLLEPAANLEGRLQALLAAESLPRRRRERDYDLRPLIEALSLLEPDAAGRQRLHARLAARAGATGRPEELVEALGVSPDLTRVHRLRTVFRSAEIAN